VGTAARAARTAGAASAARPAPASSNLIIEGSCFLAAVGTLRRPSGQPRILSHSAPGITRGASGGPDAAATVKRGGEGMVEETGDEVRAGLSEAEMRERVIRLAFGGETRRLDEFCAAIREAIPPETAAVLRGSAVTGHRHDNHAPFDADGPGTSDLDLTLVGD